GPPRSTLFPYTPLFRSVQLLSPPFQPVVLAGVPLHQFSIAAPPRPPNVYLLHLLCLGTPKLPLDHPLPHRLFARLDSVFLPQIFRRQRGPETPVHLRREDLHRLALDGFFDPPLRRLSAQPVDHGFIASFLQCVKQSLHLPSAQ